MTTINLDQNLTIYGRKPVLEALHDSALVPTRLHLAKSNKAGGIINEIIAAADARQVDIRYHDRSKLSRISKNGKQDQGVALDLTCPLFDRLENYLARTSDIGSTSPAIAPARTLIALDGVTNPQNVGMIIRSVAAAGCDGIIYPDEGTATLGPLVVKASAGTVFKAPVLRCNKLESGLMSLRKHGFSIAILEGSASDSLFEHHNTEPTVYVLGGETDGVSAASRALADTRLMIPMKNDVESLNVAIAATLVAFRANLSNNES